MDKKPPAQKNPSLPQPKKTMDLFGSSKKPTGLAASPEITSEINEILRRLRILEERYTNLRKKIQLTEQNMLEDTKKLDEEIRIISSNISDMKKETNEVSNKMRMLNDEIQAGAKQSDVDLISKYVKLWEPMNFVTQKEAEKIIEDVLDDIKQGRRKIS